MPAVPFGLIKALQARTGCDRSTAKKALEENDLDEDRAAAAIGDVPSAAASSTASKPSEAQASLDAWEAEQERDSLKLERLEEGDGATFPAAGDLLTLHYVGSLEDSTVFDSSRKRGKPFTFKIGTGAVIKGWDLGVMRMSLGEKATLLIGPEYAYGSAGAGPIPPNATLKFEVELLQIERAVTLGDATTSQ